MFIDYNFELGFYNKKNSIEKKNNIRIIRIIFYVLKKLFLYHNKYLYFVYLIYTIYNK